MIQKNLIMIMSPSRDGCDHIKAMLAQQADLEIRTQVSTPGQFSALPKEAVPKLLILDLDEHAEHALMDWADRAGAHRPPVIVIGPANNNVLMRRAMQIGARDYFTDPVSADELLASMRQILQTTNEIEIAKPNGALTAVINSKGGSGSSFIAGSLAHLLAAHLDRKTALIDLDLQFGALPLNFDLKTRDTFFDVIGAAEQLDRVALEGYMTKHESGLHVLGTMSEQLAMPWEVSTSAMEHLLEVALQTYQHVIVDLPRQIDPLTNIVLSSANRILVVMQQSFAHVRDTKRMFSLLRGYLGIPVDRITLVINRYHEKNPISEEDIRKALQPEEIVLIPNDFGHVTEALNLGVPLYEGARNAPITKVLCGLAARINGEASNVEIDIHPAPYSFKRALGFSGKRS